MELNLKNSYQQRDDPLPDGEYTVEITDCFIDKFCGNEEKFLIITFTVVEGTYTNRRHEQRLYLWSNTPSLQKWDIKRLKSIVIAGGIEDYHNLNQYLNKKLIIHIKNGKSKKGYNYCSADSFLPYN